MVSFFMHGQWISYMSADSLPIRQLTWDILYIICEIMKKKNIIKIKSSANIHYIYGGDGLACIVVRNPCTEGGDEYHYVYKDHLGSILTTTDELGAITGEQSFDAWGRRRDVNTWAYWDGINPDENPLRRVPAWLFRGYTGHEHLDVVFNIELINMNARLYDPVVGRMLRWDIYAGDGSTQGFNRYSYAMNNPLKYTDPTGNWALQAIGGVFGAYQGGMMANGGNPRFWKWGFRKTTTWGGIIIGGVTAGLGQAIAASGMPFAGTASIFFSSALSSSLMNELSGGKSPLSFSLGAASYNSDTGWGWLGKKGNSFIENLGYFWGASANVQDLATLNNSVIADVRARKEKAGHSEAQISLEDFISVGPKDKSPVPRKANSDNDLIWESQYITHSVDGNNQLFINQSEDPYWLDQVKVNKNAFCSVTDNINSGKNVFGLGKFKYAVNRGCVNYTSRGLFLSGVPNMNAFLPLSHPALLNFELRVRLVSSYNLTNGTYKKR